MRHEFAVVLLDVTCRTSMDLRWRDSCTGIRALREDAKLDALRDSFELTAPKTIIDPLRQAIEELIASDTTKRALKAGAVAPNFILPDPDGKPISSEDSLSNGPLVSWRFIYFHPFTRLDCMGCKGSRVQVSAPRTNFFAENQRLPTGHVGSYRSEHPKTDTG